MDTYGGLIRNKNFILFNIGQFISQCSNSFTHVVIVAIVHNLFPGSSVKLANTLIFTLLPAFLISPIAGVCVDRINRKIALVIADMGRCLIIFSMFLFVKHGLPVNIFYALIFLTYALTCLFHPARLSIIPDIVRKDRLLPANTAATILWLTAMIAGFTGGAFIVEMIKIEGGLFLNALVYIISAGAFILIAYTPKEGSARAQTGIKKKRLNIAPIISDLKEGIKYFMGHPNARLVGLVYFMAMSVGGALYVVTLVFIQEVTNTATSGLGFLSIFTFSGFSIGAFLFGKYGDRVKKSNAIFVSLFVSGLFVILFALILKIGLPFSGVYIAFLLLGAGISPIIIGGNTLIHESVDEKVRGRVFSFLGIMMNAGVIVSMFISSRMADVVSELSIILTCGSILTILGVLGFICYRSDRGKVISSS